MNAADRKEISALVSKLEGLQASFDEIKNEIEEIAGDEQDKFENMSEGLQASEKGQAIENAASELTSAASADSIQECLDYLLNAVGE